MNARIFTLILRGLALLALALTFSIPATAQGGAAVIWPAQTNDQTAPQPHNGDERLWLAFSDANTAQILYWLRDGAEGCSNMPWEYRIDCLAQVYEKAARTADGKPDYSAARTALMTASRKLKAVVAQNQDRTEPTIRTNVGPLRPVKPAAKRQVTEQAVAIVKEAETVLLRSTGSTTRQAHYQKIADAVGSNAILLRSWVGVLPRIVVV